MCNHPPGSCKTVVERCRKWMFWSKTVANADDRHPTRVCDGTALSVVDIDVVHDKSAAVEVDEYSSAGPARRTVHTHGDRAGVSRCREVTYGVHGFAGTIRDRG